MLFMTEDELVELTGYRQPAAQIRFLQKWRIRHVVNRNGYPKVTRLALEGGETPATRPDFKALRKVG